MKTEKRLTAFSFIIIFLLPVFTGFSQENLITKTKTVEKEFNETIKDFSIWNAFGDIEIEHWDKPTLKITVTITVLAWEEDDAERFTEKITPEMKVEKNKQGEYFFMTSFDFSNIKNVCNCKEEGIVYSPWFKKNAHVKQYSIDYSVKLPSSVDNMTISNYFGNVTLPDFNGTLVLTLKNSNLKSGKLTLENPISSLNIKYGKADIVSLKNTKLSLYSCKNVFIGEMHNVKVNSRFSTVNIDFVENSNFHSTNDNITIEKVNTLLGSGDFTDISINTLTDSIRFKNKSGTIKIKTVEPDFKSISLEGRYNSFFLGLNNTGFTLNANLEFTDFHCDKDILPDNIKSELINSAKSITKNVGSSTGSKVKLDCSNCDITIK